MYDPSMIIREVSDYVTKMKKGPQAWGGLPTARVYEWAMELAISEGHAFGPSYDDSWVRPWLRIDEPTPSLTFWDRQLTYARNVSSAWALVIPNGLPIVSLSFNLPTLKKAYSKGPYN
jgi:hypothetical protein